MTSTWPSTGTSWLRTSPRRWRIVGKVDLWPVTDEELHASTPPNILAKIAVELF